MTAGGDSDISADVIIIGGGIIGLSTGLALQRRDISVTILERGGTERSASAGNAGAFAFADILPLASPRAIRAAPRWLFDPLGPLSIPPRYIFKILPWLLRFWRASWHDRLSASTTAQVALMEQSRLALADLVDDTKADHLIRREGQLALYESTANLSELRQPWELRRQHGVQVEEIYGSEALRTIQPGIDERFKRGMFTPDWQNATDPAAFAAHLEEVFCARGGTIVPSEATALTAGESYGEVRRDDGSSIRASHVVVCAGAWSRRLAASLGDHVPLETERGYNTTLPAGAFDLRTHLTFPEHGFVVTRIGAGVRVGGAVELGGLQLPPNYARADAMLHKAQTFLPGLDSAGGTRWMGYRPSLPDSLPVIGPAPSSSRVIYAFGHGHLGLTQAAGTARLIADHITGAPPPIDMAPFRADRFSRFP